MDAIPQRLPAPALDQMAYQFSPLSDGQIRCVLRFDGELDAERLARAFRLSLDAEPVLGCRFVVRRGRCSWERRADLDELAHCAASVCPSQERLEQELERVLLATLDPFAGPAVTGRLLRGATDTLIVKINHFAADGFGLLQFLWVLAAIYGELGARPGYQPTPNLASRGQGRVFRRAGPAAVLGALGALPRTTGLRSWGPIAAGTALTDRRFALRRIGPERVRALRAWCHRHAVSVNDLLLAAFYEALVATVGAPSGQPLTVGVPLNLRRYLHPGEQLPVCNLSSNVDIAIVQPQPACFTATLAQIHAAMQAAKATPHALGQAVLAELLTRPAAALARTVLMQLIRGVGPTETTKPFLSNVGVLDAAGLRFDALKLVDAYGLGTIAYPPGLPITVSTFREVMTLGIGYCGGAVEPQRVEALLDRLLLALPVSGAGAVLE